MRMTNVPGANGIIIDSHSLQPVRDAQVVIRHPRANNQPVPERPPVVSRNDGSFSIAARRSWVIVGPPATLWTASGELEISRDGYVSVTLPLRDMKGTGGLHLENAAPPNAIGIVLPDDIPEPAAFAARLRGGKDPLSAYLFSRFSPDSQQAMTDPAVRTDILRSVLARELNAAIQRGNLYEPGRFTGVKLSEKTRETLDHSRDLDSLNFSESAYRKEFPHATSPRLLRAFLNRRLLVDAYPADLIPADAPGRLLNGNLGVILLDPVKNPAVKD